MGFCVKFTFVCFIVDDFMIECQWSMGWYHKSMGVLHRLVIPMEKIVLMF